MTISEKTRTLLEKLNPIVTNTLTFFNSACLDLVKFF